MKLTIESTLMSYLLSPFVGKSTEFSLIAHEKGDFFNYLFKIVRDLL
jgi:hypothetical protein